MTNDVDSLSVFDNYAAIYLLSLMVKGISKKFGLIQLDKMVYIRSAR